MLRVLFVDTILISSFLKVWLYGRSSQTIWHFEPLSPFSRRLLGVLRRLGLLRSQIKQVNNHIGQVRKDSGDGEPDDMEFVKNMGEVHTICSRIRREQFSKHPLINAMSSIWSAQSVSLHFERLAEPEITKELSRLSLVDWIIRNRTGKSTARCVLLLEKKQWYSYVEPYAQSYGIKVISYRKPWKLHPLFRAASMMMGGVHKLLNALSRILCRKQTRGPHSGVASRQMAPGESKESAKAPTVAIRYWHRTLDLDPTKRSEFFWLRRSGIPYSSILLYDYVSDKPMDDEIKAEMESLGIRILGRAPGVAAWQPTIGLLSVFLRVTLKLFRGILGNALRLHWTSSYYVLTFLQLAWWYAYWHDFYRANGVRVDVAILHGSVAQVLALNSLGSVSLAYQYTVGSFFPTTIITCGQDVQFVFSPMFESQYRDVESPVGSFVSTGFIYDGASQELRHLNRIAETRKQLADCGARFVLCFFDENSVSFWYHHSHDDEAAAEYEFLLEWLLSDPTLGLILKPKVSNSLLERISPLKSLISEAEKTGRCRFITSDNLYGSVYPAEAALMADVCIGKLLGGSAGFEARLAGIPTVMIDTEGYLSHPFHSWGQGRVVFDDWTSLRDAIEQFREDPKSHPEIGDWSPVINDLDPYRDGRASDRMGGYIGLIYNSFKQGESKEAALAAAAKWYSKQVRAEPQPVKNDLPAVARQAPLISGNIE